jgi:hypothetical protein
VLHKNTLRASSRRLTLFVAAGVALFAACLATRAVAERVPVAVLMANEALPDIALGKSDAPVIIVEYASMTCTHCAAFQATVYPKLKSGYVDTGKVRFILREFPLNDLDAAGFMLARCAGAGKRTEIVDLLFAQQRNWAFVNRPVEALGVFSSRTELARKALRLASRISSFPRTSRECGTGRMKILRSLPRRHFSSTENGWKER